MSYEDLKSCLYKIASEVAVELEKTSPNTPVGCCYLIGHCLAEGFHKAGYNANEVTGHLILRDKHEKMIIYGHGKHRGTVVGNYHTWCVLHHSDKSIIIDFAIKYNRNFLKQMKIKLSEKIPDIIISDNPSNWLYTYIKDEALVNQSKSFLNNAKPELINHLINTVFESARQHLK